MSAERTSNDNDLILTEASWNSFYAGTPRLHNASVSREPPMSGRLQSSVSDLFGC
jgi:hypothetical protein